MSGRAAADAAPADWIKTAIGAHATFVADVNAAYVGAVRTILSGLTRPKIRPA